MPIFDLTEEELDAVIVALHKAIDDDRDLRSLRLEPFRAALAKLDPATSPNHLPPKPPLPMLTAKPTHGKRGARNR
jgi:hypothetical protein